MIKILRSSLIIIYLIFLNISAYAQFPFTASYKESTAPNTVFGGDAKAFLTANAGNIPGTNNTTISDPEGDGYLRLTNNNRFQKGYIYNTTPFPSANGLKIEFEYYTYGGTGADGICFFLFDALANPFTIGSFGGSLGYSQISIPEGETPGVSKGYLGVGIDEYGNFSNPTEGRQGGLDGLRPGSITIRGKGDGMEFSAENYKYLTSSQVKSEFRFDLTPLVNERQPLSINPNYRKFSLDLRPLTTGGYALTVRITQGGSTPIVTTVINDYQYPFAAPANLKYGIAASTGASTNFHEIRNVRIEEYYTDAPTASDLILSSCVGESSSVDIASKIEQINNVNLNSIDLNLSLPDIQKTLTVLGKGEFSADEKGIVVFKPLNNTVIGDITIPYTIQSKSGNTSNTASIKVTIFPQITVDAGQDQNLNVSLNSSAVIQLNGNTIQAGLNGFWTQVTGPTVIITNPISGNATVSVAKSGNYTFRWTIKTNGNCQNFDEVNIIIKEVASSQIGLTKVVSNISSNSDGSYSIGYLFTLSNFGDVNLNKISLVDDLFSVFNGTSISVLSKVISGASTLLINSGYDGVSNKELLNPTSYLDVGSTAQILLEINISSLAKDETFLNTATAYGNSVIDGQQTSKVSSNSTNAAPNLTPSATPVTLTVPKPKIGLTKVLSNSTVNQNGSYDVEFQFTISNYGAVNLNKVSLVDDIESVFTGTIFSILSINTLGNRTLQINNGFNGISDKNLLDQSSTLEVGEGGRVLLKMNILPLEKEGIFINTAITGGNSEITNELVLQSSSNNITSSPDLVPSNTPVQLDKFPITIPNGFSPNNDGINDKFIIKNAGNKKISLEVFNRWANRIYRNKDYDNSWDGRCTEGIYLGADVPPGTYYYVVIIDNTDKHVGYITINR